MKEKTATARKRYIDMAKGFAILSIIAGHMNVFFIDRFVFTYHVPIFFIISGYLFKNRNGLIKKRSKRLLAPYVFTVFMVLVADELKTVIKVIMKKQELSAMVQSAKHWIIAGIYGSGSKNNFAGIKLPVIGAIWFLPAMLWASILLYVIINKCADIKLQISIVVICFTIALISAQWTWLPFSIQAGLSGLLFIYVGYFIRNNFKVDGNINWKWLLVGCMIWGVDLWFSYTNDCMSLVRCYFPNCVINILGAIAASYVILEICKLLEYIDGVERIFGEFGRCSNVVLCFHLFELQIFPWKIIYATGIPHVKIIVLLLKILWAYIGIFMTKKVEFLQKVLM